MQRRQEPRKQGIAAVALDENRVDCQLPCLRRIDQGIADAPPASLVRQLKLIVRRRLSPKTERRLKLMTNDWMNRLYGFMGRNSKPAVAAPSGPVSHLQAGDRVRVRSRGEIEATLNHWRQLKGCTFMPEMGQYCGTTQRVLKPLRRFVDERDLRAKKCSGIVLLEGAICQGTADFGPCDRSCFLFWREEWLERIAR